MASEWVRLSPEGAIGNARALRDAVDGYAIDDGYNKVELTNYEALAFARQLPEIKAREEQVQALVDTMKEIAGGSCCQWPGCCIDLPMCTPMIARAAIAQFKEVTGD